MQNKIQNVDGSLIIREKLFIRGKKHLIDVEDDVYNFYLDGGLTKIFSFSETGVTTAGTFSLPTINSIDITSETITTTTGIFDNLTFNSLTGTTADISNLYAQTLFVTGNAEFESDVLIAGGLTVLGAVTSLVSSEVAVGDTLLHLGISNTLTDLNDLGLYGEYNDGSTQLYTGLIRDASNVTKDWFLFDRVNNLPDPNFLNFQNSELSNLRLSKLIASDNITSSTFISAPEIGTTTFGVSGVINAPLANITIQDSSLIESIEIGVSTIGVSTDASISGNLDVDGNTILGYTSSTTLEATEIGVTTLGVSGNTLMTGTLDVTGNIDFTTMSGTNISLAGDMIVADELSANTLSVTSTSVFHDDVVIYGDLTIINGIDFSTIFTNQVVTGLLDVTGIATFTDDVIFDTNTLYVDSTLNRVGVGTTGPLYKLDVVGDVNASGVYRLDGTEVLNNTTLGSGVVNSSLTSVGTLSTLNVSGNMTVDTNTLVVNSSLNQVAIGTNSTTSTIVPLHLHSASNTQIHFTNTDTGQTNTDGTIIGLNANEDFFFLQRETKAIIFSTNNTERMRIDSSGFLNLNNNDITNINNITVQGNTQTNTLGVTGDTTIGANLTVNTDTLIVDSSNSNVGINTTPSTLFSLDVSGDVNVLGTQVISGSLAVDTNTLIVSANTDNVGINKTPGITYSLDVLGDTNIIGNMFVSELIDTPLLLGDEIGVTTLGVTGTATINDLINTTGSITTLDSTLITSNEIGVTTLGVTGNTIINGDLIVDTNTLIVDSTNDVVGIGATSASYQLNVSGSINAETGLYISNINIEDVFNIIQVENRKIYSNNFLTLDGSNNANGNYSGGVTSFSYTNVSSTNTLFVSNLTISIVDDGVFNLSEYGSIGNALTNGINVYYESTGGTVRENIIGITYNVKSNADWNNYTSDIVSTELLNGENVYTITLDFRNNGSYIILRENDTFNIEFNDDLTNLTSHTYQINGFLYPNSFL